MLRFTLPTTLLWLTAAAGAAAPLTVQPTEVIDTRVGQLVKTEGFFATPSGLTVQLQVTGDAVSGAASFGKIKFTQATDDAGTDLKPKPSSFGMTVGDSEEPFRVIDRFGMDEKEKGFKLPLQLASPARKATRITALKGEFQVLAGGEEKVVTITKPKSQLGKTLDDPALKAAGLELRLIDPAKEKSVISGGNNLPVQLKGNMDSLKDLEILDSAGQSASHGNFTISEKDSRTVSYGLDKPLDDTVTLKIHVMVGQKTVTVPFDLKELALP